MKCRYHPGIEMIEEKQVTPFFAALAGEDDTRRRTRRALHCPVPGCPAVAIDYDADLRLPNLCRVCRTVKVLTPGALCPGCGKNYRDTQRARIAKMNEARRAGVLHQKHA